MVPVQQSQSEPISHLLTRLQAAFVNWDFEAMADLYATPTPVYAGRELVVALDRSHLMASLREVREKYAAETPSDIALELVSEEDQGFRLRLDVRWVVQFVDDRGPGINKLTYYCGRSVDDGALFIEMVEFDQKSFPPQQGGRTE